jgi:hypothetical protein
VAVFIFGARRPLEGVVVSERRLLLQCIGQRYILPDMRPLLAIVIGGCGNCVVVIFTVTGRARDAYEVLHQEIHELLQAVALLTTFELVVAVFSATTF